MALRDTQDEILEELRRLNRNLSGRKNGSSKTSQKATARGDLSTPNYFTTGPAGMDLTSTVEYEQVEFGFEAQTVNVRFTDNVEIAFANPEANSGKVIPFVAEESPVTLGGYAGVDAPKLWIRKATTAAADVEAHVIAFQ